MMLKKRIHIVEDELIIAIDLKMFLEKQGYDVIKLDISGEEAIKTAITHKPDIILMDVNLRGNINGLEAAEKIISHNIPIIFVTSQKDEATTVEIKKKSPHYIFKPFSQHSLLEKIEKVLANQIIES